VHPHWQSVIEPVLAALEPRVVVEIGSDEGRNTKNLIRFCETHGAKLHVIDPRPRYDVGEWAGAHGETAIFHMARSLQVLPKLGAVDAVLIDGDHNWFTVFHELKLIEEGVQARRLSFPLVLLHDVDWPYGRRDLYYNPGTIPSAYRHPHRRAGLIPGERGLSDRGGLNRDLWNAALEHGPRNGVRTAVEDFLNESQSELTCNSVPGLHGIAILAPASLTRTNLALGRLLERFGTAAFLREQCGRIEEARIRERVSAEAELNRVGKKRKRVAALLAERERELAEQRTQIDALVKRVAALEEELARLAASRRSHDAGASG
jgi:hypothetical protein